MSRRGDGYRDLPPQNTAESSRPYDLRSRLEQQENERKALLERERNGLLRNFWMQKAIKNGIEEFNSFLRIEYNNFIANSDYQKIIYFGQESYHSTHIMNNCFRTLERLHDIKEDLHSRATGYTDSRNKYIDDCHVYNRDAIEHNRTARSENQVAYIDIEETRKLDPFAPFNPDLSATGLRQTVRAL